MTISIRTQNQGSSKPEYMRNIQDTINMANNKKVNAANAFEIDLNCLDNIREFVGQ